MQANSKTGVSVDPVNRHWWGVSWSRFDPSAAPVNFDEIRLLPRDTLNLFYVTDEDHDNLTDREEFIYGTSYHTRRIRMATASTTTMRRAWDGACTS